MAVVKVEPIDSTPDAVASVIAQANAKLNPDVPTVRPESIDDVLEGLLVFRSKLIDLFNEDLEKARIEIRQQARADAEQAIRTGIERVCMKRDRYHVKTSADVKALVRIVNLYEQILNKPMTKDAFSLLASEKGIPAEMADAIYYAAGLNIEAIRKAVSENMSLLAE